MKLYVNGEQLEVPEGITVEELLKITNVKVREVGFAVSVNEEIVSKSKYGEFKLSEGDRVEIVHLVGGG
ncbi:sulfur carrier protein ThiS [Thermocrinis sp.]